MTCHSLIRSVGAAAVCVAIAATALAATNEARRVLNAAGGITTSADFRQVSCVGQQSGFALTRGMGIHEYAGYLGGAILKPDLDTDGDGVADEIDPDNDNDGLTDTAERDGTAFTPPTRTDRNRKDTDGDGATDTEESLAGTNPRDRHNVLRITALHRSAENGTVVVTWQARDGKRYQVLMMTGSPAMIAETVGTLAPTGGTGPWAETTASFTNFPPPDSESRYYRIAIQP